MQSKHKELKTQEHEVNKENKNEENYKSSKKQATLRWVVKYLKKNCNSKRNKSSIVWNYCRELAKGNKIVTKK